ncbi:MAG: hypothetical protein C5B43_03190 [Verrucomicrobia bacterium]|nr:MAG: hypothetical protein C5B43_03190 [Verrucomicrobiota bacterium]
MKKNIVIIAALLCAAYSLNAASADNVGGNSATRKITPVAVKMLTVDAAEMYSKYNKAIEAKDKFTEAAENAQKEVNNMMQEGLKLGEEYNDLIAKSNNPALTESAKKKFLDEANEKAKSIREKEVQIVQYQDQAADTLAQRNQSVMTLHLNDMKDVCAKIAKENGANLVLNTTSVMYADPSTDITKEAIALLNARK